uniref:Chlororespiratory reduction 4 n=1 Tax=Francoa sonchifolia TaxID=23250 RepID=A0A0F7J476_9ROSI|nr:chlororespiratory reduction 4 [Francoa sonchifolia]
MLFIASSVRPWKNSSIPTLFLLQNSKTLNDINQLHARLITTGFIKNTSFTTKLILNLISSPHIPLVQFARYIFYKHHAFRDCKENGDPFLWNAVIKSFSHGIEPKQSLIVFCLMIENGVLGDKFSFSLVLKACSRLGLVKEGMQIHGLLRKMEFDRDVFLQNSLIGLYLRCGCVEFARQVFDKMPVRDSVSYNSMIDGYVKCGEIDSARLLFDYMPEKEKNLISWNSVISGYARLEDGFKTAWELFDTMPEKDSASWNSLIDGCVKRGKMDDAHDLFNRMPERDVITWANMIDGFVKLGNVDIARELFDQMPERDVIACNAMMAGYVQNGYCREALEIFHNMQTLNCLSPDNVTLLIVLSAAAQLGQFDEGVAAHSYIKENRFTLSGKLGVALIDMYSKCGDIENAMLVFENIEKKEVDHWNAIIGGLAIHGSGEMAFELFMEMEKLCVKPDDITFISVLNACGHAGLVKEGVMCFEILRRVHKLEPKLQHYGCVVDILGRAGLIDKACEFIEGMPIEPNDVIWRTLLSACRSHENFNIGEVVANHLIMLDSSNSSSYVLLSNIYACNGMWNDVSRIRTMMKEKNLKKIPGCSWIELEGTVHEFFVQDKSHPEGTEIYSMLDSLWTPKSKIEYCTQQN